MNRNFQNLSIDVEKAKNASTRNKGLFTSESELKSAIPSPVKGDWAVVGNSIPGTVYRCTTNGTWTNTGQQGGGGDVDLTGYTKKTDFDTFKTNSESDISELQNVQTEQGAALFTLQETQQTQDNKLATLVSFDKADANPEVGHNVTMQVAAMNPIALSEKEVPADVIAREMEVAKEATRAEGKPENMIEKIAMGRMNKFYKENTLVHQEFIMDGKLSVADYVKQNGGGAVITAFRRVQLGA